MIKKLPIKFFDVNKNFSTWSKNDISNFNYVKKFNYYLRLLLPIYNNFFFKKKIPRKLKSIGIANFKIIKTLITYIVLVDSHKRLNIKINEEIMNKIIQISFEEYDKKFFSIISQKTSKFKNYLKKVKDSFFSTDNYILESVNAEKYLKIKNKKFNFLRFSLNTEIKPNKNEIIFFNCFLSEIENFLIINEINHNKKLITKIKKILYFSSSIYESNYKNFQGKKLYHGQCGKPLFRIIALSLKDSGFKLVSFAHGFTKYTASVLQFQRYYFDGLSLSNKFLVSNSHEKQIHDKILLKHNKFIKNKIKVSIFKNNYANYDNYLNISDTVIKDKIDSKSKILVVGYSASDDFYIDCPSYNALKVVKLEKKLIDDLVEVKNLKVFYKAHPDRLKEIEGIFDYSRITVVKSKFEEVFSKFDLIIFPTPFSTTFGFCLDTKVKKFLLNTDEINWMKSDFKYTQKKCSIMKIKLSNSNFSYNKKKLIKNVLKTINN